MFHAGRIFVPCELPEAVRKYAAQQGVNEEEGLKRGLSEKAKQFVKAGEVY
jgi:phosphomethylpyrimidine synthase